MRYISLLVALLLALSACSGVSQEEDSAGQSKVVPPVASEATSEPPEPTFTESQIVEIAVQACATDDRGALLESVMRARQADQGDVVPEFIRRMASSSEFGDDCKSWLDTEQRELKDQARATCSAGDVAEGIELLRSSEPTFDEGGAAELCEALASGTLRTITSAQQTERSTRDRLLDTARVACQQGDQAELAIEVQAAWDADEDLQVPEFIRLMASDDDLPERCRQWLDDPTLAAGLRSQAEYMCWLGHVHFGRDNLLRADSELDDASATQLCEEQAAAGATVITHIRAAFEACVDGNAVVGDAALSDFDPTLDASSAAQLCQAIEFVATWPPEDSVDERIGWLSDSGWSGGKLGSLACQIGEPEIGAALMRTILSPKMTTRASAEADCRNVRRSWEPDEPYRHDG